MIAKRITAICYTSQWTKNVLPSPFNKDTTVISNPVDTELFKSDIEKENIILCVLRFIKEAQYDKMIDAFKKVGRDNFTLGLAGGLNIDVPEDVMLYEQLEEKIKKENIKNVKLLPNADFSALLKLYKTAKIFWYPNPAQFGIVLIEAQACGVVPICRDPYRTGPSEIVTNGVNGFIVNNFEEMVEKTKMLLEDENKLRKMSENARINAVENHSVEIFKKKFASLIEDVAYGNSELL
jgi:glycosyltransferase involved in cell wall biosynthesis